MAAAAETPVGKSQSEQPFWSVDDGQVFWLSCKLQLLICGCQVKFCESVSTSNFVEHVLDV